MVDGTADRKDAAKMMEVIAHSWMQLHTCIRPHTTKTLNCTHSRTCSQELNLKDEPMEEVAPAKDDGSGGFPGFDEDDDLLALMDQASAK